ncbi:receptor-like protein 9DC3 [Populus alba x Populus x berolinensis]|nr:receptor-like protein 9DC3 [Populus alba x Populus x berolinensis]
MGFSPPSLSFILFLFHFHSTISSSHLCAPDQSLSLVQFKESFSISSSASELCHHPKTESWKEGTDCCLWDGVTCDLETGHVTGLDLSCSMLYGTLHSNSTLFSLHHLQKLDLSDNDFNSSHISSRFGQFSNLTLNLNYSDFAGQVPSEISYLSKLVSLDLSKNSYPSLKQISFDKLVRNLTKLRQLHLGSVNMSLVEPNSLTNLSSSLSSLSLGDCGLQGKFPGNIFLLPNLESLDLIFNDGLTGSFPSSNLSNVLSRLDLSNTRISVYLEIDLISNLKSLEYMSLSESNIIRSDLALLGNLTQLIYLDLSGNNFNGEIPSSFGNLIQLRSLYLYSNKFVGQVPDSWGGLIHLLDLDLSDNQLVGSVHSQIITLSKLESLGLSDNLFNVTIPSFLYDLPSLYYLDIHNNNLIGNISEFQHNSLTYLDLSNNHLHGTIPSSIFKQENLEALILASNSKLTGEISSSICKLRFLQVLDLSNNSLSGSTPPCLGNFSNILSVLHLGMNNLQGTIPSTFSKENSLEYLNLNGNELAGKIPPSIINCTMLYPIIIRNFDQFGIIRSIFKFAYRKDSNAAGGSYISCNLKPFTYNTFNASSFEGNLGLCGFQVLKECYGDEAPSLPPSSFDEGDDSTLVGDGFGWKAVTIGYGCGFVFGVATGYVVFRTKKPSWFLRMVEDKWNLKSKKNKEELQTRYRVDLTLKQHQGGRFMVLDSLNFFSFLFFFNFQG